MTSLQPSATRELPVRFHRLVDPENGTRRGRGRAYVVVGALLVIALFFLSPFFLIAINAVKSPADYASRGPLALPTHISLHQIANFWSSEDFGLKLWNSLLIAVCASVGAVTLSLLNAYALGIGRVRGRVWFLVIFLLGNMLPQEALVYPLYYAVRQIGLYDNLIPVIVIFIAIHSALGTYLLTSVLLRFPPELLEASQVDGAGKWRVLWRIVGPLSRPTLMVLFVFFFIWTWNEFFIPLVFLISNNHQTVPEALAVLQGQYYNDATVSSAGALMGAIPAIAFFFAFQRTLVKGLTAGALK